MNGINDVIVLDSNAVIDLLNNKETLVTLGQQFPTAAACISVITQIEVLGYRRSKTVKLPDAVVAATAIVLNATLITRDSDLIKLKHDALRTWSIG